MAELAGNVTELKPGMQINIPVEKLQEMAQDIADAGKPKGKGGRKKTVKPPVDDGGSPDVQTAEGRKDASGQAMVINNGVVAERLDELQNLLQRKNDADEAFNLAIKATAEKSGLLASVVKRRVTAGYKGNYADKKREYEQLALLFQDTPE